MVTDVSGHWSHLHWSSSATSQKVEDLHYNAAEASSLARLILTASLDMGICDLQVCSSVLEANRPLDDVADAGGWIVSRNPLFLAGWY